MNSARALWLQIEPLHAVTYFAAESRAAATDAGLKGFWMGYFGFRAAPLGPVTADVVSDAFYNFSPTMVSRAIPDAWGLATPERLLTSRSGAATEALSRLAPSAAIAAAASPLLRRIVAAVSADGLPMFEANAALPFDPDPVTELWQLCTSLREHRGDGHVGALRSHEVGGCEAHVLHAAEHATAPEVLRDNRGWSVDEWTEAEEELSTRGLVSAGRLTDAGRALRAEVEDATDRHALAPINAALDPTELRQLLELLAPVAAEIIQSRLVPFPNPMGLPSQE